MCFSFLWKHKGKTTKAGEEKTQPQQTPNTSIYFK